MANAYSILHNYDGDLYTPNMALIQQALSFKEESLNAGRQKLTAMRDTIENMDVVKKQDQDYIDGRFKTAIDVVNQYSSLDLSDTNLTNQLTGKLGEIMDDTAKTAIISTKVFRAEQAEWEEKKKNDKDGKYSEGNRNYASQNAKSWLEAEGVGVKYGGGGGFIPYEDFQKKLMDNLPAMSKLLEADWVEIGPGQGHFKSKITGKEIKREDLRNAMGSLFNEKDYQQMDINAWNQYDKAPEEVIQTRFEDKRNSSLSANKLALEETEIQLGKALSKEQKEILTQHKQKLQDNIDYETKNTFSEVADKKGIRSIYSSMYKEDFFGGVLDAYSKRTITDIGIDEVSKENALYDLKLNDDRRAEEAHKSSERNKDLNYAKTFLEVKKLEGEGVGNKGGSGQDVVPGKIVNTPFEKGSEKNFVGNAYELQDASKTAMKNLLISNGLAKDDIEALNVMQSTEFKSQMQNLAGKKSITLGGKSIDILQNSTTLFNFKNRGMGVAKEIKENAFPVIDKMVEGVQNAFIAGNRLGSDMDIEKLPWMGFQLEEDAGGNLIYSGTTGVNNYPKLLKQKGYNKEFSGKPGSIGNTNIKNTSFSKAQDKTLQLYTLYHIAEDPSLQPENRRLAKDRLNTFLSELPEKTRNRVTAYFKPGLQGKTGKDFYISQFTTGDLETSYSGNSSTSGDSRVVNNYQGNLTKGLDKVLKDNFSQINSNLSNIYSAKNQLLKEATDSKVRVGTETHQIVMDMIGMTDPDYKKEFTLHSALNDAGEFTGKLEVYWEVPETDKKKTKATKLEKSDIDPIEFAKRGGPVFNFEPEKGGYNARAGKNAPILHLGNNIYDQEKQDSWDERIYSGYQGGFSEKEQEIFINERLALKGEESALKVAKHIQDYKDGKFKFNLEPSTNGMYYMKIYDSNNNLFYREISPYSEIKDLELQDIQKDPRNITDVFFRNALIESK